MPTTVHTEAAEPAGWRANHIEETIRSITRLHDEHHQNATPLQRAVDRITALLGRPRFIGCADRHRGRLDQPESAQPRLAIALSIRLPSQG